MPNSLAIAIPAVEQMYARVLVNWLQMKPAPGSFPMKVEYGNVIACAYDKMARWFVEETDADVLVTMELDHLYPRNVLERIQGYDMNKFPIVGAMYYTRYEPYPPVPGVPYPEDWNKPGVWEGDWDAIKATPIWPSLEKQWIAQGKLQRVLFTGLGCTAISRKVFEDWDKSKPYFADDWWGPLATHRSCDVYFMHNALKLGYPTFLDCGLTLPHIGIQEVTDKTHWEHLEKRARELGLTAA